MPWKNPEKRKEYYKKWYSKNGDKQRQHVANHRRKKKEWFENYKKKLRCKICGENDPACLDFHHVDKNKEGHVSELVRNVWRIEKIKEEISKCEVLCSNCHRKIHYYKSKNIPLSL